ncbi:alpha/beta hydrolase [Nocardia cyriacigeorgica]|uniref:Alpha/beta hydrolase n=1 Tax=Nocardia cyriacigeorgica TaxID=135487 RepID=A0A6P1CX16_9NOCA|nr:alpha/beta hydrolase [Nocardia cyriacigeorgica]NEW36034.1 alpha/beta hydrolase [Nocardia cyriacigeorgica]
MNHPNTTPAVVAHEATSAHNGYYLVGNGPRKVIVLHGWLSDASSWSAVWQLLDRHAFTWCVMDARGFGQSRHRTGEYSVSEIAQDALELADHLGWSEISLIGHSMSGLAIQRVLVAAPERVRALVAVAGVPASGGGLAGERRAMFDRAIDDRDARAIIIDRSTGSRRGERWVDILTERSLRRSRNEALRPYLDSWADGDFHTEIIGNPVPVGVIIGEHDPSLTADRMRDTWLSWYPNSCLKVIAGSGHYPMDEQPGVLASVIDAVLIHHVAVVG